MESLFPRVGPVPGLGDLGVAERVAAYRRETTWLVWTGAVVGALVFQLTPILTLRRPVLATWLDPDDLDTHAYKIATSDSYLVRQAIFLLKMMGGLFWGQSPEIRTSQNLPAYEADPGTRRTGPTVDAVHLAPRSPAPALVALGAREIARGRGTHPRDHG